MQAAGARDTGSRVGDCDLHTVGLALGRRVVATANIDHAKAQARTDLRHLRSARCADACQSLLARNGTLTLQGGRTGTPTLMRCPDSQRGWIDFSRQPISVLDNDGQNGSENPPRFKLLRRRGQNRDPGWR